MNIRKNIFLIALILIVATILSAITFLTRREVTPVGSKDTLLVPVKVKELEKREFFREVVLIGTARPVQKALISAEVAGNIVWVSSDAEIGREVNKDEALIRLDSRPYRIALEGEKANSKKAMATVKLQEMDNSLQKEKLDQLSTELDTAKKELERKKELFKDGLISSSEINREESRYAKIKNLHITQSYKVQSSEALLEQAKASLSAARARKDRAELDLERTTIKAPFKGTISARHVDVGNQLRQKDTVLEIVDYYTLVIETDIPSTNIVFVKKGVEAFIQTSYNDNITMGELRDISPEADTETRLFSAKIYIANKEHSSHILPGVFVTIRLKEKTPTYSYILPFSSVVADSKGHYVFLIGPGDKPPIAVKKYIDKIWEQDNYILVRNLDDRDLLITEGHENLINGTKVSVIK